MNADMEALSVDNPAVALELLAKDAHPMQQYREITTNALQAGATHVRWDVDWAAVRRRGVYRLACIDNGEGMAAEQLGRYINTLFVSGRAQAIDGNFGIGAKVTAGSRNPAGVVYASWQGDEGALVHFGKSDGQWGLVRFENPPGTYNTVRTGPLMEIRPRLIENQGTMVVLLGRSEDESTITAPEESPAGGIRWLVQYLNRRYFRFPAEVEVRVREWPAEQDHWPEQEPISVEDQYQAGTRLRRCRGQEWWLQQNASESGAVTLDSATVHWWILPEKKLGSGDVYLTKGQSGALFQDELYDTTTANAHRIRVQEFGILFSASRVAIYVEPHGAVAADVSRSTLRIAGRDLPWASWAAQFKAAMPAALERLEVTSRDISGVHDDKAVRDRLARYKHLWQVTAWRSTPTGTETASGTSPSGNSTGTDGRRSSAQPRVDTSGLRPHGGGTLHSDYAGVADPAGDPANRVQPDRDLPTVQWIPFGEHEDRPRDRAAEYVRTPNIIFANSSFRVVSDAVDRLTTEYGGSERVQSVVRDQVQEWYGQIYIEAVVRSWSFEHQAPWQDNDYRQLTSPEALTLAALPFTLMESAMRRAIGTQIGRKPSREL